MHYVVETTDQLTVVTALDPQQDKDTWPTRVTCAVCFRTSALYILIRPWLTLAQLGTALMFHS